MSVDYTISHQLEVTPGNKILVPGCEPTSALTSDTLNRLQDCNAAIVDVYVALNAIPGSYLKFGHNFNRGNTRQKWFVLPPIDPSCPCVKYDDYYAILKEVAEPADEDDTDFSACEVVDQGFCPSPEFALTPAPLDDPYVDEGTTPAGVTRFSFPPNSFGAS